jgi:hypothetical protein
MHLQSVPDQARATDNIPATREKAITPLGFINSGFAVNAVIDFGACFSSSQPGFRTGFGQGRGNASGS